MQTFSEKEIHIAANAIAWTLHKGDSEDGAVVNVPSELADKYKDAARRALHQIEEWRASRPT